MSFDILALLFIAFSVLSTLFNKWKERQADQTREERRRDRPPAPEPDIPEIDLSEWDVFREPEPIEVPEPPRPQRGEFREVRGKRQVSEESSGPEFQEVRGARPVDEADTGPEFQEVEGKRSVDELSTAPEYQHPLDEGHSLRRASIRAIMDQGIPEVTKRRKKKGNLKIRFDKNALIHGILYQEILGPPKSERMS